VNTYIVNDLVVNNRSEFAQLKALSQHCYYAFRMDLNLVALNIDNVRDIRTVHCVVSCQVAELQISA
jgi:hypothetical protein